MLAVGEYTCDMQLLNPHLKGKRFYFLNEHIVK